jgi:hypothetical protein
MQDVNYLWACWVITYILISTIDDIGTTKQTLGKHMKIKFDKNTMPDELYNSLLQHFVNEAVGLGVEVNKFTEFNNWVVECEVDVKEAVH